MKAILEFDLPKERSKFKQANNGLANYCALWEFNEFLRRVDKHENFSKDAEDMLERIRQGWCEATCDVDWSE